MDRREHTIAIAISMAEDFGDRTGQSLFNNLPREVKEVVRGSLFDPFHKDLNRFEIASWVDDHLIFDDKGICGVFRGNTILWER